MHFIIGHIIALKPPFGYGFRGNRASLVATTLCLALHLLSCHW